LSSGRAAKLIWIIVVCGVTVDCDDQIKEVEMVRLCGRHERNEKYMQTFDRGWEDNI
jgi:hypothetical protein